MTVNINVKQLQKNFDYNCKACAQCTNHLPIRHFFSSTATVDFNAVRIKTVP